MKSRTRRACLWRGVGRLLQDFKQREQLGLREGQHARERRDHAGLALGRQLRGAQVATGLRVEREKSQPLGALARHVKIGAVAAVAGARRTSH
ncbi:MAG: hypothetical protein ACREH8_07290 [Opitutaceae bacterium]